jgi:trimethylamine---corrinoid protein Co-methyltransferase
MIESPKETLFTMEPYIDPEEVHKTALKIMEVLGIPVGCKKCLGVLESCGCRIDFDNGIARIPASAVTAALAKNRHSHKFYNRDGTSYVDFGGNKLLLTSGACQTRIKDYRGEYRDADIDDLAKFTLLHDYYDCVDIIHTSVDATELPQEKMRTQMAATVLKNTGKPCWFLASKPDVVEKIFRMASVIRGSEMDVRSKPFFRIAVAPNAVLGFQKEEAEVLLRCSELGIPADCEHYPIMGLTAPLRVSGALALTAANFLCALVIKNAVNPDCPTIFPILAGAVNMKNAEIVTSSPEIWQYYVAGIEMGRYYDLPTSIISSSDAKDTDIQMAFEKSIGHFISASAGVDNIFDATGALDSMNLTSYEDVAIELEILQSFDHFFKWTRPTDYDIDFEIIKNAMGGSMSFLDIDHTIENFRDFFWDPELFYKDNFQKWKSANSPDIIDRAKSKVDQIFHNHKPEQLPNDVLREIDSIAELI